MRLHHNLIAALLLTSVVVCSSCQKRQALPVMVPPAATARGPAKAPAQPPPPPEIPQSQSGTGVTPPPTVTEVRVPPPPSRPKKKIARNKKRKGAQEQVAANAGESPGTPAAPQPEAAQGPQTAPVPLGQMLSDDTRKQYDQLIHDALERARANLRKARGRANLTGAQQNMAAQVDKFIGQADETRKTDLAAARSLAERADLLARDLAEGLQ